MESVHVPENYDKVTNLCNCHPGDEVGSAVKCKHDSHQDKSPDDEYQGGDEPENEQNFDLLPSSDDKQEVDECVPFSERILVVVVQNSSIVGKTFSYHGKKQ